jgi:hypothetical protein
MENFISGSTRALSPPPTISHACRAGYPANEAAIRAELANVLGKEKSEFFFDKVRWTHRFYFAAHQERTSSWSTSSRRRMLSSSSSPA